jgi:hypothetical protein
VGSSSLAALADPAPPSPKPVRSRGGRAAIRTFRCRAQTKGWDALSSKGPGACLAAFAAGWRELVDFTLAIPVLVTLGAIGTCVGCLWTALKEDVGGR